MPISYSSLIELENKYNSNDSNVVDLDHASNPLKTYAMHDCILDSLKSNLNDLNSGRL